MIKLYGNIGGNGTHLVVDTAIDVVYLPDVGAAPPIELPLVLLLTDVIDRTLVEGVVACVVELLLATELFTDVF